MCFLPLSLLPELTVKSLGFVDTGVKNPVGEEVKKSDEKALKTKMVFNEDVGARWVLGEAWPASTGIFCWEKITAW